MRTRAERRVYARLTKRKALTRLKHKYGFYPHLITPRLIGVWASTHCVPVSYYDMDYRPQPRPPASEAINDYLTSPPEPEEHERDLGDSDYSDYSDYSDTDKTPSHYGWEEDYDPAILYYTDYSLGTARLLPIRSPHDHHHPHLRAQHPDPPRLHHHRRDQLLPPARAEENSGTIPGPDALRGGR